MATVLLVEDNPISRRMFRDLLARRFRVLEAGSAPEASERLREARPDLIIMDVQLPGMDGLTFTRQLKADPTMADIPIIALSAYAMSSDVQRALDAGCADYLIKPVDILAFADRVARALPMEVAAHA
jgi:CheY-like chemotaxis protein